MTEMTLHRVESCESCVEKFVGSALHSILPGSEHVDYCGGCGQTTTKIRANYWFPWLDEAAT